jgi:hypothetical protein
MSNNTLLPRQNGAQGQKLSDVNIGHFGAAVPNSDASEAALATLRGDSLTESRQVLASDLVAGDVLVTDDGQLQPIGAIRVLETGKLLLSLPDDHMLLFPNSLMRAASMAPEESPVTSAVRTLIEATGLDAWRRLVERSELPDELVSALAIVGDEAMRVSIAYDASPTEATTELLSRDPNGAVRAATIHGQSAEFLARFEGDDDLDVISELCRAERIDPQQLARLRDNEWAPTYDMLANPALPAETYALMWDEGNSMDRLWALGSSTNGTREFVARAAADPDEDVRAKAARHDLADVEILRPLINDPSFSVLKALAESKTCDASMDAALAQNEDPAVRRAVRDRLDRELDRRTQGW